MVTKGVNYFILLSALHNFFFARASMGEFLGRRESHAHHTTHLEPFQIRAYICPHQVPIDPETTPFVVCSHAPGTRSLVEAFVDVLGCQSYLAVFLEESLCWSEHGESDIVGVWPGMAVIWCGLDAGMSIGSRQPCSSKREGCGVTNSCRTLSVVDGFSNLGAAKGAMIPSRRCDFP